MIKKYEIKILNDKLLYFKNKYEFSAELSNLSELSKKYYHDKLFEKHLSYFLEYLYRFKIKL